MERISYIATKRPRGRYQVLFRHTGVRLCIVTPSGRVFHVGQHPPKRGVAREYLLEVSEPSELQSIANDIRHWYGSILAKTQPWLPRALGRIEARARELPPPRFFTYEGQAFRASPIVAEAEHRWDALLAAGLTPAEALATLESTLLLNA